MFFGAKVEKIDHYIQKKDSAKLIALLKDNKPETRAKAIQAMGKLGDEQSVNTLIALLSSPDKELRLEAIKSVGNTENQTIKSHLQHIIQTETDETFKKAIRESIAKIPNKDYGTEQKKNY